MLVWVIYAMCIIGVWVIYAMCIIGVWVIYTMCIILMCMLVWVIYTMCIIGGDVPDRPEKRNKNWRQQVEDFLQFFASTDVKKVSEFLNFLKPPNEGKSICWTVRVMMLHC